MPTSLSGKIALVTGSSRGVGKAIALALGKEGATVVVTGRATDASPGKLPGTCDQTVREIEAAGGKALAVPADLTKDADLARLAGRVREAFGGVDILVNNAAVGFRGPIVDLPLKRYDTIFDIGLRAPFFLCRELVPGMVQRGAGWVLNISGPPAYHHRPLLALWMTKASLERFSWGLAHELGAGGVWVSCLSIGIQLATMGLLFNASGETLGEKTWERAEVAGDAAVWLLRGSDPAFHGATIDLMAMRKKYGVPAYQQWVPGRDTPM